MNMSNFNNPPVFFFAFSDVKKQSQMATLSKERDHLQNAIRTYKALFETTEQLIQELQSELTRTVI